MKKRIIFHLDDTQTVEDEIKRNICQQPHTGGFLIQYTLIVILHARFFDTSEHDTRIESNKRHHSGTIPHILWRSEKDFLETTTMTASQALKTIIPYLYRINTRHRDRCNR